MAKIVTLLTDFGTQDGFVGAMKGVVLSLAPRCQIVDLSHEIQPQDILGGAWALREAAATFPTGTIHLAVVDPGVGSARRPILLRQAGQLFVGPDNGLLSLAVEDGEGWHLDRAACFREPVSATFHGRDVFAPVAGRLAAGASPDDCGTPIASWLRLAPPAPISDGETIRGQVIHVDRFGNLVSNIRAAELGAAAWDVRLEGRVIGPVRRTFAEVAEGSWIAYVGSSQHLEIGIRAGHASEVVSQQVLQIVCKRRGD